MLPWTLKFSSHSTDTWITLVVGVLGVAVSVWAALMPAMSGSGVRVPVFIGVTIVG